MIHDYDRKLKTAKEYIQKSTLTERNKTLIFEFATYVTVQNMSKARVLRYMTALKRLGDFLVIDFDKATEKDIAGLVAVIHEQNYTEWTSNTYKIILRRFYRWLIYKDERKEYPPLVNWLKVKINRSRISLPNEGDLLTEQDLTKLLDSYTQIRDKAFIVALWESGIRISELGNLKIKHVVFDQYGMQITVLGKTGSRKIRLINATSHMATWINNHPQKGDPNASLWINVGSRNNHLPLAYGNIRQLLKMAFKRSGIKKRFNPHSFRHARATLMANHLTEFQMNQYFGWVQGSNMPSTYVHLSGKSVDAAILKMNGLAAPEQKQETQKPIICPRCDLINASDNRFCTKCGALLDVKAALEQQQQEATLLQRRDKSDQLMNMLLQDKDVQAVIMQKLKGLSLNLGI